MDDINFNDILTSNNFFEDGREYIFRVPIQENFDLFDCINNMLNELNQNQHTNIIEMNNANEEEYIHFDIHFDFIDNHNHNHNHIHNFDDDQSDYFRSCHEINDKLCKSEKIKKDDKIINEQCFICMDNYKESELKRTLPTCKHYFHKKCIDKWLKKKASCPICRDCLIK